MHVYILNAEINDDTGHFDGITTAHHTEVGAIRRLNEFLTANAVDIAAAHWGEVRTQTSLCNDPDPDTLDGQIVTWGINQTEVQA